jgi:hypothetical protein
MSELKPPSGLRAGGKALWLAVAGPFILTPAELSMLAEACRTTDELARLEKAARELPSLITTGSTGQDRMHPILGEIRAHRMLLERLTTALNLPDDLELVGLRGSQKHARKAAVARWGERTKDEDQHGYEASAS